MMQNNAHKRTSRGPRRIRVGPRTQLACVNCKERKLRCDDHVPSCANCHRVGLTCLVEDPCTRRHQSRNYVETLEGRVAFLEDQLQRIQSGDTGSSMRVHAADDAADSQPAASKAREAEDSASELSSKVGMLGLRMDGEEPHYLGSSSAFAFSRIIHSSLRQPEQRYRSETFGFPDEDTPIPPTCPLPDYELGITLSNVYFENIHPQYPFLHEPTFRSWEAGLLEPSDHIETLDFDPIALFFVNMVYCVGALLLSNAGPLPRQLYLSAQLYIDHVLSRDNLESIQAILCCAMYSLRSSKGPSIWMLSGLALRQCIKLGYHRTHKHFGLTPNPLKQEMRKRVFWCAFGIDCMAALTLGRPLGIPLQEVDAEFPIDIDDSCITETGVHGTPRSSCSDPPTTMSTALHVFRIRCLWARTHASIYSDAAVSNPNHPTYSTRVKQLRTELEDWIASIPPIPARHGSALSIFATRDWYDLNYSETVILIYRDQLTGHTNVEDSVFMECARAAESICHGYRRQYIGKPVNYTWGTLHVLFSAGLTYLHCLWTSPAVGDAVWYDGMSSTLMDCTMLLVVIAERWKGATPYRDIFEALSNRTTAMMMDRKREQWMLPAPSTVSNPVDQGDLTQWMADISNVGMSDGIDRLLNGLIGDFILQEPESEMVSGSLEEARQGSGVGGKFN
ncbi:fungal-specific transcription factor domain-containing protein [Ilyonectria sp. MPI-CAGE-AT-0026]|nr:fungal-specific transcription factor domain-containing protein [Ilyonectria sp. MPI-CAGE-AT-0026]